MIQDNVWVTASELSKKEFNALRGKICSAIESIGLPHQQERAVIAQIKQYSYNSQELIAQLMNEAVGDKVFRYDDNRVETKIDE